jgi:iron(III) transport system permease protein
MTRKFRSNTQAFKRLRHDGLLAVALILSVLFLLGFVVYPFAIMVLASFKAEARPLFAYFLRNRETLEVITNTLWMGLSVATLGTALGFLLAYIQVKVDVPFKRFFHLTAIIPIISPPFAVAMSTIALFGRSGLISNKLFGVRYDIYGADGLIFASVISFLPFTYLSLMGMMRSLDPSLEEAAQDFGASRWRIFRTVLLPLLLPGIASSFLLLFVSSISDLGNPLLLAGNYTVLASRIYLAIVGEYDLDAAAVLSVILLVPSLVIFFVQHYWLGKRSYVTVTGKPTGSHKLIRSPLLKWSFFSVNMLFALLVVLLYGYIVVGAFTKVWGINFDFTLSHFAYVFQGYGFEAFVDTIFLAAVATPLAALAGILIAFLVVRRQFAGRSLIDFASVLGAAIPGTIVGIGLILAYNQPLLGGLIPKLTGTAFIIIMAFALRSLPASVRAGVAALKQIDSSMEEASVGLGASPMTTFRNITLPLIRPALFTALVWSFARSMTSLSPIIFLITPSWRIMTAQILNEAETGRFSNAAAYSVILIVIVLGAVGLLRLFVGSNTGAERFSKT